MDYLVLLAALLVLGLFDLAALRWGKDTTDGINSPEAARRSNWL